MMSIEHEQLGRPELLHFLLNFLFFFSFFLLQLYEHDEHGNQAMHVSTTESDEEASSIPTPIVFHNDNAMQW